MRKTGPVSIIKTQCVAAFRLVNTKCMTDIELWKKILHPNLVHLREVFTTKAFGDNCTYLLLTVLDLALQSR